MKEIKELLEITKKLKERYKHHGKNFTIDGRLVGDIGEVLAAEKYGIFLYPENTPQHDGYEISTNRKIQIKASFKSYCYFPFSHVPEYFLALNILDNGEIEEMYNGTGQVIMDNYIVERKLTPYNNTFYTLSRGILET
ncbi:MAG: hypothetical protein IPK03_14965 [Bacteroidetes bacterium]|nr:hypothetical protein [Bacteroidota bacterium]